jgi:hypothetical protein
MSRLRACWATHSRLDARSPQHMDPAGGGLDYEQHVPPLQEHGVHGEAGPPPAHPRPGRGGTAARSGPTGALKGGPDGAGPQSCSRAGRAHRRCGDSPRSGSRWPAAAPEPGSPPPHRTATPVWVAPAAPNQVAVPAQQRGRLHEPPPPDRARQHPRKRGQHRAVGPVHLGSGHLSAEHRDLVPQHQQLRVVVAERRVSSTSHPRSWQKIR